MLPFHNFTNQSLSTNIICVLLVCKSYELVFRYVVVYYLHGTRMSFFLYHLYVLVCYLYSIQMHLYLISMSLACHLCVIRMYSHVTCMSLLCTRISFVWHSYVLVSHWYALICHSYVTRMYSNLFCMRFYHEPCSMFKMIICQPKKDNLGRCLH